MQEFKSAPDIQVVLATYNGEKYIDQQLRSILSNSIRAQIIIHDDGSSDGTLDRVEKLSKTYEEVNVLSEDPTGGAKKNFGYLLSKTVSPYVLCSDQDDIWHVDKMSIFMEAMIEAEKIYGSSTPLLIHSDLRVIDDDDKIIMDSFWRYQNLNPAWGNDMQRILTQNVVTGCAMMANRALLDIALPIPEGAVMHDWWLALVACAFGRIVALPIPTVDYRQHSNNEVGAKKFDLMYIKGRIKGVTIQDETSSGWRKAAIQASAFAERFPGMHDGIAEKFAGLPDQTYIRRLKTKLTEGFWKIGAIRNIGWLFLC